MPERRHFLIILTACWAVFSTASAESLIEVYERARLSDPQIREADALRLANREALPQSRSALLPQIDFSYSYTEQEQDGTATFTQLFEIEDPITMEPTPVVAQVPTDSDTNTDTQSWRLQLRQSIFRWDRWVQFRRSEKVAARFFCRKTETLSISSGCGSS